MDFIHHREKVLDSTNKFLGELVSKESVSNFYTVSAAYQSSGKGQDDNVWESEKDKNILMSTYVYPDHLLAENAFQISRWVSISIVKYLQNKGLEDVKIKWPNDIYIGKKKIAGILIQNAMTGDFLTNSMFGIGLNVNQLNFTSDAPNPISLAQITQQSYDVIEEIDLLLKELQFSFHEITQSPQLFIETYEQLLYRRDEWFLYRNSDEEFEGKIKGVDQFGQLIMEDRAGVYTHYDIKEIQFVI